ncbi:feline leukemia virus subgroup C receptor-related protein 2 [Aplysia californica]|uniref:Feline leukemia virus subgroup C receptor-related protein 2 n=1 Tax=Aplysia californica TaxID=6500 RepID=A0ABM1VVZ7_APLCA|nr:feline leukemia virus subgroup C receptor-related protein 2 [Aplysia californica]
MATEASSIHSSQLPSPEQGVQDGTGKVNAAYEPDGTGVDIQMTDTAGQGQSDSKTPKSVDTGQNSIKLLGPDAGKGDKDGGFEEATPRVYKRRWLMLGLFCLYSFSNAYQWIHLNIIGNVLDKFYNESLPTDSYQRNTAIDWLSMIYMLAYIPIIFPATWLLDKRGLRTCCICGSLLNAVGAWLKCASVAEDRFALLLFAQTLCAIAQVFVLGIPARLAAVWFGPNQVSTATSIGVFGNQVGVAIGFVLPPMLVPNSDAMEDLSRDFYIMFYTTAGVTTVLFFLIIIFFKEKPPLPPSRAQQLAVEAATHENYFASLLRLIKNRGFVVLTIAYGINTGSFYAISTLLSPVVRYYFESIVGAQSAETNAGRIGLTIVLLGVAGAVVGGIWLDRTKTFKSTTIAIYVMSLAGMVAFTFTLDLGLLWVVYVTAGSLGFFMTGYLPVGFEFAAEITFPESEGTSSGLLNASAQTFGIIFTLGMRAMTESVSVLSANILVCVFLLLGAIMTAIIKPDYRRQEAGKQMVAEVLGQETEVIVEVPGAAIRDPKDELLVQNS